MNVSPSSIRPLFRLLGRQTVGALLVVVGLGIVVRLAVIATAREAGRGELTQLLVVAAVMGLLFALQRFVQARARVRVEVDLLAAAAHALVVGDVLATNERDFQRSIFESEQHARSLVASALPLLLSDLVAAVVAFAILGTSLPARVLVVSGLALVMVLGAFLSLRRFTQALQSALLGALQAVYDRLLVAIEGRLEIVARGHEKQFERGLSARLHDYRRVADRVSFRAALLGRAPLVIGGGVVVAAFLADGTSHQVLGSALVADALLIASCLPPIIGLTTGAHDVVRLRANAAPLVAILARAPRPQAIAAEQLLPAPPFELVIADLSFRYAADAPDVLGHVNVRLRSGQCLFVAGQNGHGKSTLLRMVLGLHAPTEGRITLGGVDLQNVDLALFRRRAAYLPQEPYLGEPYMSVGMALRMFWEGDDEQAHAALSRAGVLDALRSRGAAPLDVPIGTLSAGQRQRVALARVLVQDASLVILDEPDAYLDSAGVALVARIIEELVAAGTMVAVAAHSPELAIDGAIRVTLASPR